jgi:hypothetical protein
MSEDEMKKEKAFELLDFGFDEAEEADRDAMERDGRFRDRDRRICACGHPFSRHHTLSGRLECKPSKMYCKCKNQKAVLESDDTRFFLRKTMGAGALHALGRGLKATVERGIEIRWVIEPNCEKCGEVDKLSPVPVTQHGIAQSYDTGYTAMLCRKCRESV